MAEVLGARRGQVLVTDSVTVNLYKLVHALLDADPSLRVLATDRENFPTDRYVLDGIARARGLELVLFDPPTRSSGRSRTTSRATHSSSCHMSVTAPVRSPTWPPSTRSRR